MREGVVFIFLRFNSQIPKHDFLRACGERRYEYSNIEINISSQCFGVSIRPLCALIVRAL